MRRLKTIEKLLVEKDGDTSRIIIMLPYVPEKDILIIRGTDHLSLEEYYTEYGEINVDEVVGNILEMPDYKAALEEINQQYRDQLSAH